MNAVIKIFFVPILILNVFGAIGSGIWLGILGEWVAIGIGIASMFIAGIALALALAPSVLIFGAAAYFYSRIRLFYYLFILLDNLYVIVILTIWCCGVLYYFMGMMNSENFLPMLVWSYSVATGPINWMAQKEEMASAGEGSPASAITAFFAQVGYILLMIAAVFFTTHPIDLVTIFGSTMLVGVVFLFQMNLQVQKLARELGLDE